MILKKKAEGRHGRTKYCSGACSTALRALLEWAIIIIEDVQLIPVKQNLFLVYCTVWTHLYICNSFSDWRVNNACDYNRTTQLIVSYKEGKKVRMSLPYSTSIF